MTLVFNASPLIVLAKAGLIDPVLALADRVLIPRPVALEIAQFNHPADAACAWIGSPVAKALIADPPAISEFVTAWGFRPQSKTPLYPAAFHASVLSFQ